MRGQGYGKQILSHLVDQAALIWAFSPKSCDLLFLDVYASNKTAIGLYKRFGFAEISDEPIPDPDQGDDTYIIMARRISFARNSPETTP
jgi:ribosomal protein S18 acetylase RimI-like enzyme